ncbi:MAG: SMP-30/gluconolactonase/LRE family protein [Proteobacteria bacterium]|nr:SMP-30/gluconolactonase/LRE family protein [Pseudomonadota bacterium]
MDLAPIPLDAIDHVGSGLQRPECVIATKSGNLYVSDKRGGVTRIRPDGSTELFVPKPALPVALHPNGIALERAGSFLIAHLADDFGGVWRLFRDGRAEPVLTEIDGKTLPAVNFVLVDKQDRIWVTISTRRQPRGVSYRADISDGFVILIDKKGARIVADGIGFTNEVRLDAAERELTVVETFSRRLCRFDIAADGSLSGRRVIAQFGAGTFPDGIALDVEGAVWVTSVVSNRVLRVTRDGKIQQLLEDADPAHLAWVEKAYLAGEMSRPHLDTITSRVLRSIASIAFGGPDLKTAYLGCLLGERLPFIRVPVAGLPMAHWEW